MGAGGGGGGLAGAFVGARPPTHSPTTTQPPTEGVEVRVNFERKKILRPKKSGKCQMNPHNHQKKKRCSSRFLEYFLGCQNN